MDIIQNETYTYQFEITGPRIDLTQAAQQVLSQLVYIQTGQLADARLAIQQASQRIENADQNTYWSDAYRNAQRQQGLADLVTAREDYLAVLEVAPATLTMTEVTESGGDEPLVILADGTAERQERKRTFGALFPEPVAPDEGA